MRDSKLRAALQEHYPELDRFFELLAQRLQEVREGDRWGPWVDDFCELFLRDVEERGRAQRTFEAIYGDLAENWRRSLGGAGSLDEKVDGAVTSMSASIGMAFALGVWLGELGFAKIEHTGEPLK